MTTTEERSSSYKLWDKRLDGDTLTRGEIGQFCNAVAAGALGYEIGGARTKFTPEECTILFDKFTRRLGELPGGGYALTSEHTAFGLSWLRNNPRLARGVGIGDETLAEILQGFRAFRFVGVKVRRSIAPIWRVFYVADQRVQTVDYWASPWQQSAYGN